MGAGIVDGRSGGHDTRGVDVAVWRVVVRLDVVEVHRVEADRGGEQAHIRLGQVSARQIAMAAAAAFAGVQC